MCLLVPLSRSIFESLFLRAACFLLLSFHSICLQLFFHAACLQRLSFRYTGFQHLFFNNICFWQIHSFVAFMDRKKIFSERCICTNAIPESKLSL